MAKRINISFKENERDTKILLEINSHSDKSAFIKDAIQFYLNSSQKVIPFKNTQTEISDIDESNEILNIMG